MSDDAGPSESSNQAFVPVCAIGASAGGVTALQGLFRQLPDNLGLAYVVVLHLSPDQPSALSDILSGCTRMPVLQIQDGPTLQRDCVYVIPPDRELVIDGDSVTARPFSEPRGRRAPIDMFFRSIAAARGDGVAIVLSGAGSDGTLGVQAVKAAGGVIMVQEPAEAAFPSMPQNAIASGAPDFVAPLARLAERLAEVARSKEAVRSLDMDGSANDLRRIVAFLRARTGHDFSGYKRATVMRRVLRRMQVCQTDSVADYADYLAATPEEAKELFSDLLISVTMFFRDPRAFEALERQAIKALFDDLDPEKEESIRAWVVGCATGEEAYSVAMLLLEEAARRKVHVQFQIFASDLDEGSLATAREGRYPHSIEADVSEERLARFFIDEGTHYRVRKELRESVLFATHSVLKEPPFMRLDLITCRNLLIYVERALQQQICSIFHYGLKPGRFLFLGSAETADAAPGLFAPLDRDARIYGARPQAAHALPMLPQFTAPERFVNPDQPFTGRTERGDLPVALHVSALERTAPASVLVDGAHNIFHLSPSAGRFILHSAGPVSNQLPAIVRPELRLDLKLALTRALDGNEPTLTHPAIVALDGERRRISIHVAPVPNGTHMGAQALVLFLDGGTVHDEETTDAPSDPRPDEVRRLHAELKAAQEAAVASRAGHEASMQDLRATNEELQSINEEYRSTAEELETSKEELQSINEELHTVNAELKSKLTSISVAHSDLQNLTDATEIGTLFLDGDLRIKMFTPPMADIFNITKRDYGRTITDFSHRLDYDAIDDDARRVLRQLAPIEREVHSREARSYVLRMRPYRTIEDRIDGVVVTFFDITDRLEAQAALAASEEKYRTLFESIDEGVTTIELIYDQEGTCVDFRYRESNPALERMTGLRDIEGKLVSEVIPTLEPEWLERYARIVRTGEAERFEGYSEGLGRWLDVYASRVGGEGSRRSVQVYKDVTKRKRAEVALRDSEARLAFDLAGMQRLHALHARLAGETDLRVALEAIVCDSCEVLETDRGCIQLVSEDGQRLEMFAFQGYESDSPFIAHFLNEGSKPACDAARRDRSRLIIEDVASFPALEGTKDREVAMADGIRATQSTPMISGDGDLRGVLSNQFRAPHRPAEEQLKLIDLLVWTAADFVARHKADAALRESEERQIFLLKLSDALRPLVDPEAIKDTATRVLGEHLGVLRAQYWEADPSGEFLESAGGYTDGAAPVTGRVRMDDFGTYVKDSYDAGRVMAVANVATDPRVSPDQLKNYDALGFRAWAGVPLVKNERFVVALGLHRAAPYEWTDAEIALARETAERTWAAVERARAEAAQRDSEARFRQFAGSSSDGLWIRNAATLAMEYASPAIETIYGVRPDAFLGEMKHWAGLIVPDDRDAALKHIEAARGGNAVVNEFRIQRPSDGAFRWIRNTDFPLFDSHGNIERIGGIAEDVTDAKLASEHQNVLLEELQHRVRNIMAVIRSITARTGERAQSVPDYASSIAGRLLALARVQTLLTRGANVGIGIRTIVQEELSAQAPQETQYVVDGADLVLSPKAAEVLTLAVHELATNALKYGAFSGPDGRVAVRWATFERSDILWLGFDWIEQGAPERASPNPALPRRRGFGSELIEGRVSYELRGSGKITIEEDGARCHLEFPLQESASILETDTPKQAAVFGGSLDMSGAANLSGHCVLVVEDDFYLATDTARAIQGAGAEVLGPCPTEDAARNAMADTTPTAAVVDINLGLGPSFKLAAELKRRGIPFVFITGYDDKMIPAEFDGVKRLQKPVELRQVVGALAQTLGVAK